ncbi:DNA-binding HxlR family transcriptional regulator [Geomicrobium halophilum]|uniref:DNA-binding HxlR family transcriptional regulator n=1 Tax=Geomicrobium halophilum TaxID=549000 RepID=A0A841PWV6_9BACL|nr:helix-turn-helix domain-containing protein [Geomicrobium halophilum]MBB6451031.1 DNA-binding HxlR family transcriptional regulator [Geomicrobium halophilum]
MELRREYHNYIEITLDVVCGKWKGVILCHLLGRTLRFGELKKEIPDITQKMLTQQLRELEEDGLVERVVYNQVPPKVEYSLTPYGEDLRPMLETLSAWGERHAEKVASSKEKDGEDEVEPV